ncbi:unnamed protein product [Natator depressus]
MEPRSPGQPAWKWQVLSLLSMCGWGWVSGQIRYSVVEESELGTVVGNVAQDLGLKVADLLGRRLRLGSAESRRYFAVSLASGTLLVNEKIDRESLCGASAGCVLPVQVVIETPLELFRLEVEILDLNDNSPSFPIAQRTVRIAESATVAARFPLESAQDPDVGTNTVSSYQLSPSPYFSLDVKKLKDGKLFPELVLEQALDREDKREHHLVLTAIDGGNPARSGTAQITVVVVDINDNAPVFDQSVYKVSLPENTPVGTLLIQLNATDPDEGPSGEVQYSFAVHTSDSVRKLFDLDPPTGAVRVQGAVDFEEAGFYEIHLRARDRGVPEMEGHCVLQVEVEDVNDNSPEVLLTSLVNPVPENTPLETVVGLFNVRDRDSGANGEVSLGIASNLPFKIKSFENHYALITRDKLDRESVSQYTIELTARDAGSPSLTTETTILLNISDVNDNPPSFSQTSYNAFLSENSPPGSLLCTVSASDPDEGENSRLTYSIAGSEIEDAPASSFVHINPDNGNVYAQRTFDFELLQVLQIPVAVQDSGSPPHSSNVTVYVFILDQNDNAPVILHPVTGRPVAAPQRIPQSVPAGYLVTKVTAVDADSGHNAWLSYSLLPQSTDPSLFRVAPYTGEIRTARGFQDTDLAAQKIVVLVKDNGDPALSCTVTLMVSLEDKASEENSKSRDFLTNPKEKPDLTLYLIIALVAVSMVSLVTFIVLSAKCLRKRDRHSCCCLSNSPSRDIFKHSSPKLQLNTDGTLKYMEVTLRPTDSQSQCYRTCFSPGSDRSDFTFMRPMSCPPPSALAMETDTFLSGTNTSNESGQVKNCRFHGPFSSAQIRYAIPEELTRGAFVGNIAKDLGTDLAKLAAANLQVLSDSDSQYFSVNVNTGIIVVNDRIDRERLCGQNLRCFLHLKLAIENPVEFYRIEVEILDINDNPPAFPSSEITLQIYELASLGARFPIHQAQDLDVGSNALQTYHLSANENFNLNVKARTDGSKFPELVLERALDREHRAVHHLVLTAEDGGSPPRSSKTRIAVQVLDANDNHPVFDKSSYQARLVENSPSGTLVIKLNATDVDEGPNGEVRYSLGSHNSEALRRIFSIDDQTGEIRLQGNLDFEEASVYEIEVEAKDMGSPTMEEHCSVTVEVTDVNDNPPEVVLTSFSSFLSEDAPPGTVVAVIHVKDRDSGEHGKVQCHLPRSLPFKLRKDFEHQYSLLTSQELDRESVFQYNVTISASDLGIPSLSRYTVLSITVADINDNTPQFERASYDVVLKENNQVGEILVTVSATDPDLDQNSRLSYSVLRSPGKGPATDPSAYISINPTSGQVSAKLPFDYEQTTYFQFQVEVSDGGSPALSSRTVVHVFVTDQNDNAPGIQFPLTGKDSIVQLRIPRSTSPQALITKITAVDLDSGRNAWLSYHLMQATDPRLFGVALRSGEIRTTRALQEQDAATQELFLVVKDSGEPPMSTSVTVLVLLEENAPEAFLGLTAHAAESESVPRLTLYLIISLATISALSLVALVGLGVRCVRRDARAAVGCCVKADTLRVPPNTLLGHVQPSLGDATIDVQVTATAPPAPGYRSCFSPVSDISEFMFMKPSVSLGNGSGNSPPDRSCSTEVSSLNMPGQCPQLTPPCDLQRVWLGPCGPKAPDALNRSQLL